MHQTYVLIILQCIVSLCSGRFSDLSNGKRAEEGQFPFAVYIQDILFPGIHVPFDCSGSIVSGQWVLSAAHCVQTFKDGHMLIADRMTLVAGVLDSAKCDNYCHSRTSKNVYIHPGFRQNVKLHDVCLIKTSSPFELSSYINSISLSYKKQLLSDKQQMTCTLVAFSRNRPLQKNVVLVYYTIPVMHFINCDSDVIDSHRMCSSSTCGSRSCPVGPGGSLVCQSTLVGVVSGVEKITPATRKFPCSVKDSHIVYHYTGFYLQWLQSVAPAQLRATDIKFDSRLFNFHDQSNGNLASSRSTPNIWNIFSLIVLSLVFCDSYFTVVIQILRNHIRQALKILTN